jgi:hypothetical protein
MWSNVKGPATAIIATMKRLGWQPTSATTFIDDEGDVHDVKVDPPVAIKHALNRSTRRWRLNRINSHLPELKTSRLKEKAKPKPRPP